jgi:RNA polymerase sigma-70 factor (ECF subfamily)
MHSPADEWDWSVLRLRALRETRRVLSSHDDAEDAAQDALLRAWRARAACADQPSAWVRAIARREALRTAAKRLPIPHADPFDARPEAAVVPSEEDRALTRIDVGRALDRLRPYDRCVVAAYYGADISAMEVAKRLGSTEATVRVRLFRARKRLRAVLEE